MLNGNAAPFVSTRTEPPEGHTDLIDIADAHNAFEALMDTTNGDATAAAILAAGTLIADAIRQCSEGGGHG